MSSEDYRKKIEENILKILEEKLVSQKINATRAKEIAKMVLASLHPHMSINQIHQIVQKFDDYFPELVPVVLNANMEYDEKVKKAVHEHAGKLIEQGKINEAVNLTRQALNKQIKLPEQ